MNWSPRWARPWYLRLRGKMRVSRTWHTELHGVRARCTHGVRNLRAIFAPASWKVATLSSSSEDSPAATTADPGRLSRWRLSSWRRCGRRPPGSSASEVRRAARAPAAAVARLVGYPRTARSGASCHAQHALADPMLAGRQHQTDRKNPTKESYLAATVAFIGSVASPTTDRLRYGRIDQRAAPRTQLRSDPRRSSSASVRPLTTVTASERPLVSSFLTATFLRANLRAGGCCHPYLHTAVAGSSAQV